MAGGRHFPLILCTILILFVNDLVADRKLSITYNEQCNIPQCQARPNQTSYVNLVHVSARGTNDTIHFLWSSIGAPSVLVVRTTNLAVLQINWEDLIQKNMKTGSISFRPKEDVFYASSLMFSKLIEFNDTTDEGILTKADAVSITDLQEMQWQNTNTTMDTEQHSAVLNTTLGQQFGHGTLSWRLTAFSESSRYETLPYLQHTENSTQLDLTMENLTSKYPNSRFAVEVMVMGTGVTKTDGIQLEEKITIDDEYTPAVFATYDLNLPSIPTGSYSQWKPVCYTKTNRAMENARHVSSYKLENAMDLHKMPNKSIAHAYFSEAIFQQAGAVNVSFGIAQDGFYKKSNYSSWSVTVGYGDAPQESMSLTVYIVISVGVGLPVLVVIFGGAGVCVLNHRKKKRQTLEVN
ncbi:glycosylated lysosomal membrane protein B-like [Asterias rubens]|uniref:glycosylated lysosomal membrane protein B-like n=1 Tax=Asterias rubens TaxID=7604 RepID=UPI001455A619|nr:glycosylated lysosomal membrane protein B-like [Asterias rubens]